MTYVDVQDRLLQLNTEKNKVIDFAPQIQDTEIYKSIQKSRCSYDLNVKSHK